MVKRALVRRKKRPAGLSNHAAAADSPDSVSPAPRSPLRPAALLAALALAVVAARAADGPAVFADNCASCHGMDGRARTPAGRKLHAKDLTLSRLTDEQIEHQIREGQKDEQGRQAMPPFKDQLAPDEIKALIPVVKSFRK